jgi:hypothetical protein
MELGHVRQVYDVEPIDLDDTAPHEATPEPSQAELAAASLAFLDEAFADDPEWQAARAATGR